MEIAEHIRMLEAAGARLRMAAQWTDLKARVPSCPEWNVAELVRHVCEVHFWANWVLNGGDPRRSPFLAPQNVDLFDTYDRGLATLLETLLRVPDDLDVWSFLSAPSPKAFWARRQAHETMIHAVDAELAADAGITEIPVAWAVDGLDELLMRFAPSRLKKGMVEETKSIMFAPIDANISWTVAIGPEKSSTLENAPNVSDLSVMAASDEVYRWAWNRATDYEVSLHGDVVLSDLWRAALKIRWS